MDTTDRVQLFVPNEQPRFRKHFPAHLKDATTAAKEFLREYPAGVAPADLEDWVASIDHSALHTFHNTEELVCAATGVYYSVVAEGMDRVLTRQFIGALGQIRLTKAVMTLNLENRRQLLRLESVAAKRTHSVLGVARLAAALNAAGARCYLPTAHEDARWKIDLLFTHGDAVACVQVKQGQSSCRRIVEPFDPREEEFLRGVHQFSAEHSVSAVPLWVAIGNRGKHSATTMCSPESIQFGMQVVSTARKT